MLTASQHTDIIVEPEQISNNTMENIDNNYTNATIDNIKNESNMDSIKSPDYNFYLNYSADSPMLIDSSITPFGNNNNNNNNNDNNNTTLDKGNNNDDSNTTANISTSDSTTTTLVNNATHEKNESNNNNDDMTNDNNSNSRSKNNLDVNNSLDYVNSTITNLSSPSLSSSTTKLNTANNSTANLSKLNFRFNYVHNNNNNTPNNHSNNNHTSINKHGNSTINNTTNKLTNSTTLNGSVVTDDDSPINLQSMTSPSAMTDLLELLDDKENEQQQQQQQQLISPLQLISKINSNEKIQKDFLEDDDNDDNMELTDTKDVLDNTLTDFVNDEFKNNDILMFNNDRRLSQVISNNLPPMTDSRNSISHSIDFWDLSNNNKKRHSYDNRNNSSNNSNNQEVSHNFYDYNMNFTNNNDNLHNNNISNNSNPLNKSSLYSPKQNIRRQRSSMPTIPSSNELFNTLYENMEDISNDSNSNQNIDNTFDKSIFFDDMNNNNNQTNIDLFKPSFFNNINTLDHDTNNNNTNNTDTPIPSLHPNDNNNNTINNNSENSKFIKPSMMLSDKASIAAKLAVKGGMPKFETFPTIDSQQFNHPTRIMKRKSISTIPNSSLITNGENSIRRRKSSVGIGKNTPNTSNGILGLKSPSLKNSSASPSNVTGKNKITNDFSNEEKPFKCAQCIKAFRRSEHLKRHIRSVHSNERPFPCTLCDKRFSRSDNLSQHLKTHKKHGDF